MFPTSSTSTQDPSKEALNCLRVLGRVLTVVYEAEADDREHGVEDTFAAKYMWSRQPLEPQQRNNEGVQPSEGTLEAEQFTIEDSDTEEEDEIDAGVRAFKATVTKPSPSTTTDGQTEQSAEVNDPLSQPDPPKVEEDEKGEETMPCLVDRLFSCTVDLLFCAGFTLPESVRTTEVGEKINVSLS